MQADQNSDPRPIRVYDESQQETQQDGFTDDDTDSGVEDLGLLEMTDDQRLARNQQYLADHIARWTLSSPGEPARNGRPIQTVERPTISKLDNKCLHPMLYTNAVPIGTLERMAEILDTNSNWREIFSAAVADNANVNYRFRALQLLGGAHEPAIQFEFAGLVLAIASALHIQLHSDSEKRIVIGGMLVREELNVCGKTDPFFCNSNHQPVLASEVKTDSAFPLGTFWHRECRASQILSSLYAHGCPAVLFTPMHFKFFFESAQRDRVFTFPADQDPDASQFLNASLMGAMGRDFLKAICICLLSRRAMCAQEPEKSDVAVLSTSKTSVSRVALSRLENSADRGSKRTGAKKKSQHKAKPAANLTPKFVSGYCEGQPVYTDIRVASDGAANMIWQRIRAAGAAAAETGAVASGLDVDCQRAGGTLLTCSAAAPPPAPRGLRPAPAPPPGAIDWQGRGPGLRYRGSGSGAAVLQSNRETPACCLSLSETACTGQATQ